MSTRCLLVILLLVSLIVFFTSFGNAKDKDLIFYMSFDKMDGDRISDDSGNESLGTLNGDAEIVKDGKYGSAVSLSGAGYVDCGNNPILNQAFTGLTIEAWARPRTLVPESAIAVKWAWTIAGDHFGLFMFSGKGLVAVADGVTS